MTCNHNAEAAWTYHDATKHSYLSICQNPHFPDEENRPSPFKVYPESSLGILRLDPTLRPSGIAALSAISENVTACTGAALDFQTVAQLLFLSAGVTRRRSTPSREVYYRAASCTGALYEVELYLVCDDLPGLPAGVHHFSPADFALRTLRAGDYRQILVEATGGEPSIACAPVIIVWTCIYWRNAWKYAERSYRHFGWDNGTLTANLLAACSALKLSARVVCGFVDADINRLLDLDSEREVAFSLVAVGHGTRPFATSAPTMAPLNLETIPLSRYEVDYPLMRTMHAASSFHSPQEVRAWRRRADLPNLPVPLGPTIELRPSRPPGMSQDSIEEVILRRGSCRRFSREPISFGQLSDALDRATRGIRADFLDPSGTQLNQLYLIVNAVEDLPSGAYVFHRDRSALEPLSQGEYRVQAGHIALEQKLAADAAVNIFFLADLRSVLRHFGNRGYRAVQLEAGIIGGKLYLGAYAQSLSATGLTFYDDEVTQFFSPHAHGKSAIFLVALGKCERGARELQSCATS